MEERGKVALAVLERKKVGPDHLEPSEKFVADIEDFVGLALIDHLLAKLLELLTLNWLRKGDDEVIKDIVFRILGYLLETL